MLKRVLMVGLLTGAGLATAGVGDAQAQNWWDFVEPPGTWWGWGSLEGCAVIKNVPSTTKHAAYLECGATITRIEFCCANRGNPEEVRPGQAFTRTVFFAQDPFGPDNLLVKQKGRAKPCAIVTNASLASLVTGEQCVNPNWTPIACPSAPEGVMVVPTQFEAQCTTIECIGEDDPGTTANEACDFVVDNDDDIAANDGALQLCSLPEGYGVEADEIFPIANPIPGAGGTQYVCKKCIGEDNPATPENETCSVTE